MGNASAKNQDAGAKGSNPEERNGSLTGAGSSSAYPPASALPRNSSGASAQGKSEAAKPAAPQSVPHAIGGKVQPYARPKGTVDSDSEDSSGDEDFNGDRARKYRVPSRNPGPAQDKKLTFEDFEPLKVIGNGCFGKVMMVRCSKDGKIFAMKTIKKAHVVKNEKVRHTQTERNIMQKINHPFVMKLHYAFQNGGKLYMVMDYLNGGDIFYHLSLSRRFPEERARFYAAEVTMALECLHEHGFIYRDLKPENVLTDSQGHIRLTDFGLSKEEYQEGAVMNTFVGTTEYLAPEVLKQRGYGKEVDWWSLGVLIFEMITGCPPFYSKNRQMTFRMILSAELNIPDWLSPSSKGLIKELLVRNPAQRLGVGARGAADIKRHAFFDAIDFPALYRKEVDPPYKPPPLAHDDTSHFDSRFTAKPAEDSPTQSPEEPTAFDGFSYQSPTFRGRLGDMAASMGSAAGSYSQKTGSLSQSQRSLAFGGSGGSSSVKMKSSLPRINSGEDLKHEIGTTFAHDGPVMVPKPVAEGKETGTDESEDGLDSAEEEGYEKLGQSLIQSSLADHSPRWREHDSQARKKGDLTSDSPDSAGHTDEEAEKVEKEEAKEETGDATQFGLDE